MGNAPGLAPAGAIRQLRWEDIDWATCTIHWRAEADKKRREAVIPMPLPLANDLRRFQWRLGMTSR